MKAAVEKEQMNVVIVGHVDHGKSTFIGRLLADTGSLPDGKLDAVKASCARNAKPFEYAFLLDALKDEQSQGITIDTARSFFKSDKRDYIIIDAPGHIEFLKNMVTGAARAEAAFLLIDANEGIKENSRRHGYMMSFLGIKNINVCVNKMDLVDYSQEVFEEIKKKYTEFLNEINLKPKNFIPISAREGDNMVELSKNMSWYKGDHALAALDKFEKAAPRYEQPFRMPVQDIYKFTEADDDRRIVAGRVETGTIQVGESVIFLPSGKTSKVKSIEGFNVEQSDERYAGQSAGVTLDTQIYIRPGELMCKMSERRPHVSRKVKANVFWMGRTPLVKGKTYKLKISTQQVPVVVSEIINVLDASELSSIEHKQQVDRHDVAECILETLKPISYDEVTKISSTGRFVIVDNYEICGGGIILAPVFDEQTSLKEHIKRREINWLRSTITPEKRSQKNQHKSALIVITGQIDTGKQRIARALEEELFAQGKNAYFLGLSNETLTEGTQTNDRTLNKAQYIQQIGELAHTMTDAGLILITSLTDIDQYDLETLRTLNRPNMTLVVNVGENHLPEGKVNLELVDNEETSAAVKKIAQLLSQTILLDPEFTI